MTPIPEALPIEQADPKPWWQSRTLIGAAVVMLASVARLALPGLEIDTHALTDAVLGAATLLGGALAWYGRVRASQPIRRRRPAAGAVAPAKWLRDSVDVMSPDADTADRDPRYWGRERGPLDPD